MKPSDNVYKFSWFFDWKYKNNIKKGTFDLFIVVHLTVFYNNSWKCCIVCGSNNINYACHSLLKHNRKYKIKNCDWILHEIYIESTQLAMKHKKNITKI